jgi:hypothetical protein
MEFWQSPKPLKNPLALNLRIIGNDKDGRPITYTCFSQAHDRFDVDSVILNFKFIIRGVLYYVTKTSTTKLKETTTTTTKSKF